MQRMPDQPPQQTGHATDGPSSFSASSRVSRLRSGGVRRGGARKVPTFDEVAAFVREETGYRGPLTAATALRADMGVVGDDLWELIDAYATRFAVDVSGFRWYFHSPEEGFNLGGLFF